MGQSPGIIWRGWVAASNLSPKNNKMNHSVCLVPAGSWEPTGFRAPAPPQSCCSPLPAAAASGAGAEFLLGP